MDFQKSLVIAHGPNAGLPRASADIVMDDASQAKRVTIELKRRGFVILGWSINKGRKPVIRVAPSRLTDRLIFDNAAAYSLYKPGERHGQFQRDGVHVVWIERPPRTVQQQVRSL